MPYVPRHFVPWEVFPHLSSEITWDTLDPSIRAQLSDQVLETADDIQDLVGLPCLVNDYPQHGEFLQLQLRC